MLVVDGIDVRYGRVRALHDVSLVVNDGSMVALFGANGAGKTTTLRAISGMVEVSSGSIAFDGATLTGDTPEEIARLGVAHIPEGRGIFPRMSVRQNLTMGGYAHRLERRTLERRIDEVLEDFPALRDRLAQHGGTLSGGEQQMLAVARALIGRPRLLMIDEPSHGLAPRVVGEVFELLSGLAARGVDVLIVEQYATTALRFADRAYVLERGRVALSGDAAEIAADWQSLAVSYLGG